MRGPRATSVGWLALGLVVLTLALPSGALGTHTASSSAALPNAVAARSLVAVPSPSLSAGPARGSVDLSQRIGLDVVLQSPSSSQVEQLIQEQQTPTSPEYHQFLTPTQFQSSFDPSPAAVSALQRYFAGYGFTWSANGPETYLLSGTVGMADQAFRTTLEHYGPSGGHAWAPSVPPTLPAPLAPIVASVAGLNTLDHPRPTFDLPVLPPPASPTAIAPTPSATITLSFTSEFFSLYGGATPLFAPPVGMNVSITATVTGGGPPKAPCTWSWTFGDGGSNSSMNDPNCASNTVTHEYVKPYNQFWPTSPTAIVVNFADSAGNSGTYNATVVPSMSTQWMQKFYDEIHMIARGSSGAGTTIGLDEMCDPSYDNGTSLYTSETDHFSAIMGLPSLLVNYIGDPTVAGSPTYCYPQWGIAGWAGETLLDMEWAHAMAPNATLEVYFGVDGANLPWENYMDIAGGDQVWANNLGDNVFLGSNSWGVNETYYSLWHNIWAQAAAEGLSLFASSGDCGSSDGSTAVSVGWPASDPDGVAVGGTILQMTTEGRFVNEYVWNGTVSTSACQNNEGTGGGWSKVFKVPAYQSSMAGSDKGWAPPAPPAWPIANPRGLPDVSADAATWSDVYFNKEWVPTGGTSLASPMWMAMADTILDAIGYGQRPAGILNTHVYAIGTTNVTYGRDFHDITLGDNCNVATGCTTYSATSLWDPATGWGSPDVQNLTMDWNNTFPAWRQVSGYVLASTGGVVSGALVSNGFAQATTDTTGYYLLYAPPGSLTLKASATGFATATRGVIVNTTDLSDVNITLYPGPSYYVTGTVITEVGALVSNGLVVADQGTTFVGSSGTNGLGQFGIWLPVGAYTLTGSAPYLNSSSIQVSVSSNLGNLIIRLAYPRVTVEGLVLSYVGHVPVWGANVVGSTVQNGVAVTSSQNTSTVGQFFIHLPQGTGSLTAKVYPYLPNTTLLKVWQKGIFGIVIFLYPDGSRTTQVDLAVHILDPKRTPQGVPVVASGSSLTLEIWANNSLTLTPQLGIWLFFNDQYSGQFSSYNVSVSMGGAGVPPLGVAFVNYTAPFLGSAVFDDLVIEVGTPGWTGSSLARIYLTPNFATACATGPCAYPVWGVVVSTYGQRLTGAQVTIEEGVETSNGCGPTTAATGVSNFNGIYSVVLPNNTDIDPIYYAYATLSGFYNPNPSAASCTTFVVNGTSEEVDLVLAPVPPTLTPAESSAYHSYRNLFLVDGWAIIPFLAMAMILITAVAARMVRRPESEEKEEPAGAPKASAEQAIFDQSGGGGAPLPPGGPPDTGPAALPQAPAPETPWEITPAPTPPPPDSSGGLPPLPDQPETPGSSGGAGTGFEPGSSEGGGPPPLP
ncbi:MAG: carboxypeptidase regulatory-like domain-containing protein [Euryarchaeota archaeon]|nr:carboxypeptidase regulatory-like domain-containing protein [Euryarchaeota archaeon]